jgi:hypothetical protein
MHMTNGKEEIESYSGHVHGGAGGMHDYGEAAVQ